MRGLVQASTSRFRSTREKNQALERRPISARRVVVDDNPSFGTVWTS